MSNGQSFLDKGLEALEEGVSQVKQQAKSAPSDIATAVVSQVTGKSMSSDSGTNEAANAQSQSAFAKASADKANQDFVDEMYAPSGTQNPLQEASGQAELKTQNGKEQSEAQKKASEFIQEKVEEGKTVEEAQKLYSLRQKLHKEYYERLTAYEKAPPEPRTAEKVEEEKKQDEMKTLEEQKKKDAPIAVQMAANRSEQFPGASG